MNANEHLSGTNFGDGHGFEADVIYTAIYRGLHGGRDGLRRVLDGVLSGNSHEPILDDVSRRFGAKGKGGSLRGYGVGRAGEFGRWARLIPKLLVVIPKARVLSSRPRISRTQLLWGDPSLRLKDGSARDDAAGA